MTELEAQGLAETLVLKFVEEHKVDLDANRLNGDTLGVCTGKPLYEKLENVRTEYLHNTDPRITYNTNIFNLAVIKHILQK